MSTHSSRRAVQNRKKMRKGVKVRQAGEHDSQTKGRHVNAAESPWRKGVNAFPTGRQLPRTPPRPAAWQPESSVSLGPEGEACPQLHSSGVNDEDNVKYAATPESPEHENSSETMREVVNNAQKSGSSAYVDLSRHGAGMTANGRRHSTLSAAAGGDMNPDCFIRGMEGYHWTTADLEFVEHAKYERSVRQLKMELSALLKVLKNEQQRRDLSQAVRDRVQTDLAEVSDFERLLQLGRELLQSKLPAAMVACMKADSVLTQLRATDVQWATRKETSQQAVLQEKLACLRELHSKEEQSCKKINSQNNANLQRQANVDALKKELFRLQKQLSEAEETLRATQCQVTSLKVQKRPKEEEVDMNKILRRSKRIAQRKENFLEREKVLKKINAVKL